MPQASSLLWWVFFSVGFFSASGFLVVAAVPPHQMLLLLHNANSLLSFLLYPRLLVGTPGHLIWLLELLLLYPPGARGSQPAKDWCSGTWPLHTDLAST